MLRELNKMMKTIFIQKQVRKRLILVVLVISFPNPTYYDLLNNQKEKNLGVGTGSSLIIEIQWNKTYGGTGDEFVWSIIQTDDNGFLFAGKHSLDMWLVKIDTLGTVEWNQTYGESGNAVAYSVLQTEDGGFILAGAIRPFDANWSDMCLVKVDAIGMVEWNQTFGGAENAVAYSVLQTEDGGFILAGSIRPLGAIWSDMLLVKVGATGVAEWNRTYGGTSRDWAYSVLQTDDGDFVLTGATASFGAGSNDMWLVKVGATGVVEWNKTYGGIDNDLVRSVHQTNDGGFVLVGSTGSLSTGDLDMWLVKVDATGTAEWNKTYGGTGIEYAASSYQTDDGGFLLAGGTKANYTDDYDMWLVKVDAMGTPEWNRTYGGTNEDEAWSVLQTNEGGFIVAGTTSSPGGGEYDIWLVKISDPKQNNTDLIPPDKLFAIVLLMIISVILLISIVRRKKS